MAKHRKTEHYTPWQKVAWILVPTIAFGGLWFHKLGLLLIPIMATLIVLGFRNGKYWCGKLCPHGSLFDLVLGPYSPKSKSLGFLRSPWLQGGFFVFYIFMFIRRLVRVIPLFGSMAFWDRLGFLMAVNYLMPTLIGSTLALLIGRRAWCSICPMGTMQKISHRLGRITGLNTATDTRVTMVHPTACRNCGLCQKVCPMGITLPVEGQLGSAECIKCETCVFSCPVGALAMQTARSATESPKARGAVSHYDNVIPDEIKEVSSNR